MYHGFLPHLGATLSGLCLAHAVLDKETDLRRLEMEGEWPIWGKPGTIHVENAAEFYSEALRRGCDQHGIRIAHRPVGQPHCGGTIERVLGTVMQRVHTLPGTTFANPQDRGTSASARSEEHTSELQSHHDL